MGVILLLCNFENEWMLKLHQHAKLRLYKNIKQNYNMKKYLSMNIPKSHRSLLAQFKCGIIPIRIETGRYRGKQYLIDYVIYVHKIMLKTNTTSCFIVYNTPILGHIS